MAALTRGIRSFQRGLAAGSMSITVIAAVPATTPRDDDVAQGSVDWARMLPVGGTMAEFQAYEPQGARSFGVVRGCGIEHLATLLHRRNIHQRPRKEPAQEEHNWNMHRKLQHSVTH